jgi:hypothetical protein
MWATNVKNWANDVKNWATEQGSGPNLGEQVSQIRASLGMLRVAQAAQVRTATSSGSLSHCSVLNLVCSGSKAEIDFGKVSFPLRVWWYYQVKTTRNLLPFPTLISAVFPVYKQKLRLAQPLLRLHRHCSKCLPPSTPFNHDLTTIVVQQQSDVSFQTESQYLPAYFISQRKALNTVLVHLAS